MSKMYWGKWTENEFAVMVAIGSISGFLSYKFMEIVAWAAYSIGGSLLGSILSGTFYVPGLLAAYLIRKRYTALITQVWFAFAEMLLRILAVSTEADVLFLGFLGTILAGVGFEIGFAIWKNKRYDILSVGVAAAIGALIISLLSGFLSASVNAEPLESILPQEILLVIYIQPVVLLVIFGISIILKKKGVQIPI